MKLEIKNYIDEWSFHVTETYLFFKTGKSNVIFQKYTNWIIIFSK